MAFFRTVHGFIGENFACYSDGLAWIERCSMEQRDYDEEKLYRLASCLIGDLGTQFVRKRCYSVELLDQLLGSERYSAVIAVLVDYKSKREASLITIETLDNVVIQVPLSFFNTCSKASIHPDQTVKLNVLSKVLRKFIRKEYDHNIDILSDIAELAKLATISADFSSYIVPRLIEVLRSPIEGLACGDFFKECVKLCILYKKLQAPIYKLLNFQLKLSENQDFFLSFTERNIAINLFSLSPEILLKLEFALNILSDVELHVHAIDPTELRELFGVLVRTSSVVSLNISNPFDLIGSLFLDFLQLKHSLKAVKISFSKHPQGVLGQRTAFEFLDTVRSLKTYIDFEIEGIEHLRPSIQRQLLFTQGKVLWQVRLITAEVAHLNPEVNSFYTQLCTFMDRNCAFTEIIYYRFSRCVTGKILYHSNTALKYFRKLLDNYPCLIIPFTISDPFGEKYEIDKRLASAVSLKWEGEVEEGFFRYEEGYIEEVVEFVKSGNLVLNDLDHAVNFLLIARYLNMNIDVFEQCRTKIKEELLKITNFFFLISRIASINSLEDRPLTQFLQAEHPMNLNGNIPLIWAINNDGKYLIKVERLDPNIVMALKNLYESSKLISLKDGNNREIPLTEINRLSV